jgi:hypothetical protein
MKTALWIVGASLALTWIWGGNQEAIPLPPESFVVWLSDAAGANNADEIGRLHVLYMLAVSFIVVAAGTGVVRWIMRSRRHPDC